MGSQSPTWRRELPASAVFTANVPNIHADIREPHQGVDMNQESHTLTIVLPSDERVAGPGCDLNVAGAKSIDETLAHCFSFSNLTQLFGLK